MYIYIYIYIDCVGHRIVAQMALSTYFLCNIFKRIYVCVRIYIYISTYLLCNMYKRI